MAEVKIQSIKYEMAMNNMKQLYELAGRLNMKTPGSMNDKQQFLVRYKDIERYRQQMEEAISVLFSNSETFSECQKKDLETNFASFNDMFYSIQVLHDSLFKDSTGPEGVCKSNSSAEFHLPKISLPRFSGSYTDWPNFISIFNSLIHENSNLSNVEKMHYLLSVLDKEPLCLVKNLKLSNTNYSHAYQLLTERYENKRVIADKHIEAILNLQNLSQMNFRTLNKFVNTYKENLSALDALDFDVNSWSFLLLHIILKKLSIELRTKFESEIDPISIPTFDQLSNFLEKQLRVLENISTTSSSTKASSSNTLSITHTDSTSNPKFKLNYSCPCCNENHNLYHCSKFDAMTQEQRKGFVMKQKLCFNCLRSHHISKCSSSSVCQVCRGRHHTKLHVSNATQSTSVAEACDESAMPATSSTVQIQSLHGVDSSSTMVLGTAIVEIQDASGHFHLARALIDCGSQVSIMTDALAQQLGLPRTRAGGIFGLGASSAQRSHGIVGCNIRSAINKNQTLNSNLLILKKITNDLPSVQVHETVLKHCSNLILADKNFTSPGQIDLLFGIDLYDQILDGRRFSLGDGMPTAYSSIFGWIIMGKAPAASAHDNNVSTMACTVDLNLALTRFWEAEQPPNQPLSDPEDILCEKHFCDTHARDPVGRFVVRLPFKVNHKPLGDTYMMALKRFYNLERHPLKHVKGVLYFNVVINSTIAWCDSNIVLSWLKKSPRVLQTDEGNRVSQIQALTSDVKWSHVPSELNAADYASRGLLPSKLATNSFWWSPPWLKEEPVSWPEDTALLSEEELPGVKSSVVMSNAAVVLEDLSVLNKYSSSSQLQSVVVWSNQFVHNLRNPAKRLTGNLSVVELCGSTRTILTLVQAKEFAEALHLLRNDKPLRSSLIRLNPLLDAEGLLRVGGRIANSELDYDAKHPLLLPKDHHVTKIIIDHYHRTFLHPGVNTLQNLLQRKYWILSARRAIRRQIFQCLRCYRLRPKSVEPFMADLPVHRVTSCRPFQRVGVDFAGPFLQKISRVRNSRSLKSYLCIFICFATKCVHLEIVSELSTEAFLACLDRFVSRRGLPSDIFSDCGTNFVGARNHLREVSQFHANSNDAVQKFLACKQIVWHLNPPASPHMGGLWESAVRSAKLILARVIGDRPLLFEELATIFSKVEAALNSRPLCPLSNDPNDLEALTPGHFLIGQPLLAPPEQNFENENLPILKRWQLLRQITQHFWKRWQAEYLHTLQQRPKWLTKHINLQEGDLVLVKDSNLPPLLWRKARVIRACPGSDGVVRVVEVRTSTGNLLRPVVKLCPLLPNLQ